MLFAQSIYCTLLHNNCSFHITLIKKLRDKPQHVLAITQVSLISCRLLCMLAIIHVMIENCGGTPYLLSALCSAPILRRSPLP